MLFENDLGAFEQASGSVLPISYDLSVELFPSKNEVRVRCLIEFETDSDEVSALLDHSFKVSSIKMEGRSQPLSREGDTLRFKTKPGRKHIELEYRGVLNEYLANVVSVDQVELNLNLPWYPLLSLKRLFVATLTIGLPDMAAADSARFELYTQKVGRVSLGNRVELNPAFDICIVGGRDPKGRATEGDVSVISFVSDGDRVSELLKAAKDVRDFNRSLYGPMPTSHLNVFETTRKSLGGYSREGLVCLQSQEGTSIESSTSLLAHEIAHQWWGPGAGVSSLEDWLSEGVATYSQYLYLRGRLGPGESKKYLERNLTKLTTSRGVSIANTVAWKQESFVVSRFGGLFALLEFQRECPGFVTHLGEFFRGHKGTFVSSTDFIEFFSRWIDPPKMKELIRDKNAWSAEEVQDSINSAV